MRLSSSKCRGRVRDEPGQPGLSMRKCRTDPWRERAQVRRDNRPSQQADGSTGRGRERGPSWVDDPARPTDMQLYGAPGQIHAKDTPFGDIVYQGSAVHRPRGISLVAIGILTQPRALKEN